MENFGYLSSSGMFQIVLSIDSCFDQLLPINHLSVKIRKPMIDVGGGLYASVYDSVLFFIVQP